MSGQQYGLCLLQPMGKNSDFMHWYIADNWNKKEAQNGLPTSYSDHSEFNACGKSQKIAIRYAKKLTYIFKS